MSINIVIVDKAPQCHDLTHVKEGLRSLISTDHHVIYEISQQDYLQTLWEKGACLIVILLPDADHFNMDKVLNFVRVGGNALIISTSLNVQKSIQNQLSKNDCRHHENSDIRGIIVGTIENRGLLCITEKIPTTTRELEEILNLFNLEKSSNERQSSVACHLSTEYEVFYQKSEIRSDLQKLKNILKTTLNVTIPSLSINFKECNEKDLGNNISHSHRESFMIHKYFQHLKTKKIGRTVIYSDIMESSYTLLEKLLPHLSSEISHLLVCSRIQTAGRGSAQHKQWISPLGQACFTFIVCAHVNSPLARHDTFMQHVVSLSILLTVKKLVRHKETSLCIKWPNDLFYKCKVEGQDVLKKLAGVLVTKYEWPNGNVVRFLIGVGFNLFNKNPTISLKEILDLNGASVDDLSMETFIANVLNDLENLFEGSLTETSSDESLEKLRQTYLENWIHQDQNGVAMIGRGQEELHGRVCGIDLDGQLLFSPSSQENVECPPMLTIHPNMDDLLFHIR